MTVPPVPPNEQFGNLNYFYANNSFTLGSMQQPVDAVTLVTVDYTQLGITIPDNSVFSFLVDRGNGPPLYIVDPILLSSILTFLVSGGIPDVTYTLTVNIAHDTDQTRSDSLAVNVFASGDQGFLPSSTPVGNTVGQLMVGTSLAFFNTGPRYFVSASPPEGPNIMDEWWNELTNELSQFVTDGSNTWWQTPSYDPGGLPTPTGPNLVLVTDAVAPYNYKTVNINSILDIAGISLDMGTF